MNFKLTLKSLQIIKSVIWILYGIYLIYTFLFIRKFELLISVLFCGFLLHLTLIKFINNWYKYNQPRLLDWFLLGTFISVILNFLSLAGFFGKNERITVNNVAEVSTDFVLPSLLVVLVGLFAMNLSEFLIFHKKKKKKKKKTKNSYFAFRHKRIFFVSTIIILFTEGYLLLEGVTGYGVYEEYTTGTYSFLLQIIGILSPMILAIYAVLKYIYKYSTPVFNVLFFSYFIAQIGFGFLSGMKEEIITPIIVVLIPYFMSGKKLPKKFIYLSLLFIVLLYPINNNYRIVLNENPNINKTAAFQLGVLNTVEQGFVNSIISGAESYQSRFALFPILMYSVSKERDWDNYKFLNRYVYLPVGWVIPRFVLPEKPVANTGAELNYMISGSKNSSITPSTYGWAFFEGGYVFVFITFLLFGLLISFIEKILNKKNVIHLVLYIAILVSLLKVESDIYFRISSLLQTILVCYLLCTFFLKSKKALKLNEGGHNSLS